MRLFLLFLGGFLFGVIVIVVSFWLVTPQSPSLEADLERIIGRDILGQTRVAFAEPPVTLLINDSDDKSGWLYLTPFAREVVAFSFEKDKAGSASFGIYVGEEFSLTYRLNEIGSEMLLQNQNIAYRDLNADGSWDIRLEVNDSVVTYILFEGVWMLVRHIPRLVDGGFETTAFDGLMYRFDFDAGTWTFRD